MIEAKRRLLAARVMSDIAAAQSTTVAHRAASSGVFRELKISGAETAAQLAAACGIPPSQMESMLVALAASGYIDRDSRSDRYSLSAEQVSLFVDEDSDLFLGGALQLAAGLAAGDSAAISQGIARSSRAKFPPLIERRLTSALREGCVVSEIGCGSGGTLIEVVRRHAGLRAVGVDRDAASIDKARAAAQAQDLQDRVRFVAGDERDLGAAFSDVVLCLEMLHEVSDPAAVARAVHAALRPGGTWFLVEPCVEQTGEGNDTRFLASLGALYCLPAAKFAAGALGPMANRQTYQQLVSAAGFDDVTVTSEGPIHVVIEARR